MNSLPSSLLMVGSPENKIKQKNLMEFRKDINALRAVAVIAVVIFHFNADLLTGGFAGVDVFFAISGYLMTGIILSGIEGGKFSLSRFYASRAKRIIPALSLLCLSLIIFGWFFLPPLDYRAIGKHALSSMTFVSNFIYWQEAGYFDAASHEKWLLHTWSLSAEWQFYLIYPLIISALSHFLTKRSVRISLLVMCFAGYIFSVTSSYFWPTASYFLLPSRAWEMLAGGMAYIFVMRGNERKSVVAHYVGLGLIIASYFIIDSSDLWPGWKAILPVTGAVLFLTANHQGVISRFKPALLVGKWSYSIYLWHWPVVVYCYLNKIQINTIAGVLVSIFLGFLSYFVIENRREIKLVTIMPVATALSAFVLFNNGYAFQMPKKVYEAAMLDPMADEFGNYTWKNIKKLHSDFSGDKRKVLVIGDSTAGDFVNVMLDAGVHERSQIRSRLVSSNCGAFYLNQRQRDNLYAVSYDIKNGLITKELCNKEISMMLNDKIVKEADVIVISMSWRDYAIPFIEQSLRNLRAVTNKQIFVVGNKNFQDSLPRIIYEGYSRSQDIESLAYKESTSQFATNNSLKRIANHVDGVAFIDIKNSICSHSKKKCTVFSDGFPVLYDSMHATKQGALFISNVIKDQLSTIK